MTTEIFVSFAAADEPWLNELDKHLTALKSPSVRIWDRRQAALGENWDAARREHLETARLFLFLVSADFIASHECYEVELGRALDRRKQERVSIIPILVRPTDLDRTVFGKQRLTAVPSNQIPVTKWPDRDAAWTDVVRCVRLTLEGMGVITMGVPVGGATPYSSASTPLPARPARAPYPSSPKTRRRRRRSPWGPAVLIAAALFVLSAVILVVFAKGTNEPVRTSNPVNPTPRPEPTSAVTCCGEGCSGCPSGRSQMPGSCQAALSQGTWELRLANMADLSNRPTGAQICVRKSGTAVQSCARLSDAADLPANKGKPTVGRFVPRFYITTDELNRGRMDIYYGDGGGWTGNNEVKPTPPPIKTSVLCRGLRLHPSPGPDVDFYLDDL